MPTPSTPGRSLVTRRALVDVVRSATLGSYGVTGFRMGPVDRLLDRLDLARPGLRVRADEAVEVELDLEVAHGVPVAEVARQVDSAVRYAIERAVGLEVRRLVIHVGGLRVLPAATPTVLPVAEPAPVRSGDLADSGTDVA